MVPVPEQLASKVLSYVSWKGHPRLEDAPEAPSGARGTSVEPPAADDDDPIARAFARLDDGGRALVAVMAAAALDQEQLTVPDAARRAGLTTREAVGTIMELNNLVADEGGLPIAVFVTELEGAEDAEFTWDARVVMMPEPVAVPLAGLAGIPPPR